MSVMSCLDELDEGGWEMVDGVSGVFITRLFLSDAGCGGSAVRLPCCQDCASALGFLIDRREKENKYLLFQKNFAGRHNCLSTQVPNCSS